MNYLAHALLSNNNKGLLIGNFIADHIRGNDFKNFPEEVIKGIQLHRKIDTFTDSHPEFKKSKRFFYDGFEKYSGILIDIYFDHLLAKNFELHSSIPLDEFSKNTYQVYSEHQYLLPKSSSGFLDYLMKNNIYHAYSEITGIKRVLYHLSHRIKHNIRLDNSIQLFKHNEAELKANFDIFFEDALAEFSGL